MYARVFLRTTFSPEGQHWGNPVYNWQVLREENFEWLVKRIEHSLKLYDLLRIDHFRGFVSYSCGAKPFAFGAFGGLPTPQHLMGS
jgi:hypothetical protein